MKKYYESADLHAVLSYSKIRKDYDLVLNVFVPSDIIEVKKVIEKLDIIEKEIKKISNEDIKNSNFSEMDTSILNSQLFITKSHSFHEWLGQ